MNTTIPRKPTIIFLIYVACFFCMLLSCGKESHSDTRLITPSIKPIVIHSGVILKDEFWSSDTIHRVAKPGVIVDGCNLTIEDGSKLEFEDNVGLIIKSNAKIFAMGGRKAIIFTSIRDSSEGFAVFDPAKCGFWNGLTIEGKEGWNSGFLSCVSIRYAGNLGYGLQLTDVSRETTLNLIEIYSTCGDALYVNGGEPKLFMMLAYHATKNIIREFNSYLVLDHAMLFQHFEKETDKYLGGSFLSYEVKNNIDGGVVEHSDGIFCFGGADYLITPNSRGAEKIRHIYFSDYSKNAKFSTQLDIGKVTYTGKNIFQEAKISTHSEAPPFTKGFVYFYLGWSITSKQELWNKVYDRLSN